MYQLNVTSSVEHLCLKQYSIESDWISTVLQTKVFITELCYLISINVYWKVVFFKSSLAQTYFTHKHLYLDLVPI